MNQISMDLEQSYNNHEQHQKSHKNHQKSSILLSSHHNHHHQTTNLINQKIQAMKHSINQMSILSTGKPLQNINKIETQLTLHKDQVQNHQKRCMNQLNHLQKTLLSIQKQRFLKDVYIKNQKQAIKQELHDFQEYIGKYNDKVTHKISQFRDKITDLKIQMVQSDVKCKERSQKIKQKYIEQVMNHDKYLSGLNKGQKNGLKDKIKGRFKQFNVNIEEEHRKILKEKRRYRDMIDELKSSINRKIDEQQYKQKQGFQHNYDALQQIFSLLASQVNQK